MGLPWDLQLDLIWQLALAAVLGAAIGFEREWRNHIAGLRTHALVSVGAALFTMAGAYGFVDIVKGDQIDPLRVAAQVASGIGFIGAGAIIRHGRSVRGVTTAASLWMSAAIGVATGAGLTLIASAAVVVTLVVLIGFRVLEAHGKLAQRTRTFELTLRHGSTSLGQILEVLERLGAIQDVEVEDAGGLVNGKDRAVTIIVETRDTDACARTAGELAMLDQVAAVRIG